MTQENSACKQKPVLSIQQMVEMQHNQDKSTLIQNVSRTHNVGSLTVRDIKEQRMKS